MISGSNFNNHSGGAKGADSAWDEIGREFGVVNHFHYWYGRMNPKSKPEHEISEEDYQEGILKIYEANKILKRNNFDKYMSLLARNWLQVKNSDAIYAIGYIENNKVTGGTGWAVSMGILEDKEIYVFDQHKNCWNFWNNNKFEYCTTPKLTKNFAGIGSREITEDGLKAIRNVYTKSLK